MYFPDNMTFQYFFFDTYIGYFLQMIPIALLVSVVYGVIKHKATADAKLSQTILSSLFIAYLTGLVGLVLLLDIISDTWYLLFYHMNVYDFSNLFAFDLNLVPDFWKHINGESIGNFIMFMPFGILYPLAKENVSFKDTMKSGAICVGVIEILQPIFGRAFDINDVILNMVGIFVSAAVFFASKRVITKNTAES